MNWNDIFEYRDWALYWRIKPGKSMLLGSKAGTIRKNGYLSVGFGRSEFYIHRIVWEMHNGSIPDLMQIDHIDQIRTNNKIENLRLVTSAENNRNQTMQHNNTSGYTGVTWRKDRCKWSARIEFEGKVRYLGNFSKFDEAVAARKLAEHMFGFHENHGKRKIK